MMLVFLSLAIACSCALISNSLLSLSISCFFQTSSLDICSSSFSTISSRSFLCISSCWAITLLTRPSQNPFNTPNLSFFFFLFLFLLSLMIIIKLADDDDFASSSTFPTFPTLSIEFILSLIDDSST